MTLPVVPMRLPSDIDPSLNGLLPAHLLTKCGYGNFVMHHLASRARKALSARVSTLKDPRGVPRQLKSTGTYRTYAQQQQIFDGTDPTLWSHPLNGRYVPQVSWSIYEAHGGRWAHKENGLPDIKDWNGKHWKRRNNTAMAAVPGTSNHGYGLADDFAEELDDDSAPEGISQALVDWLCVHAIEYGFSAEAQSEKWHWRYVAGDNLPKAVLDFETGIQPTPLPSNEDDMPKNVYYSNKEPRTFQGSVFAEKQIKFRLTDAGKAVRVDGEEIGDRESIDPKTVGLEFGIPKSNARLDALGAPN